MSVWTQLSAAQLRELAAAVGEDRDVALLKHWGPMGTQVAAALDFLRRGEMHKGLLSYFLGTLAEQAKSAQSAAEDLDVVWTGPEGLHAQTRDTMVTVRQMLEGATRYVLLASYILFDGESILKPLAARMAAVPSLDVTLILNISRRDAGGDMSKEEAVDALRTKVLEDWPHGRVPTIYYDPRALQDSGVRAVMHAKCVVVDDRALVTSANLSNAAQLRNIELGLLTGQKAVVDRIRSQFTSLIESAQLTRLSMALPHP